jgi:hypothetical protein
MACLREFRIFAGLGLLAASLLLAAACSDAPTNDTASVTGALPGEATPLAEEPAPPQGEGWFSLQGDIDLQVEEAEVRAERLPGEEGPPRLMVELQLRRGAGLAPEAGVVLLGLAPDLAPGEYALRAPQAGSGLRAFIVARSDRVGSMRDFTEGVTGTLRVTESPPGELVASFRLAAVEAPYAPPRDDEDPPPSPSRGGTAPESPPGRLEAQGAFRLPLAAVRAPEPAPLAPTATAPLPMDPSAS